MTYTIGFNIFPSFGSANSSEYGNTVIIGGNPLMNEKVERIKTSKTPKLTVSAFWHYLSKFESQFTQNFVEDSKNLWDTDIINPGTATAYDATLTLIEAIRQQNEPTRKGTLKELQAPGFIIEGVTGVIRFNTPENGDRIDFKPTVVKLGVEGENRTFRPVENDD